MSYSSGKPYLNGRGAQINPVSKFEKLKRDDQPLDWALVADEWEPDQLKTECIATHPKTILNKVVSEDIHLNWSMNPYQGCEHGCVYCYARNTHPFWGYSAGLDFERKILVKANAATLLDKELGHKNWTAAPVMFAGNTDVYQPVERTYKITRACLEVFLKHRNPVSVITKNSLILRDLDILIELNALNLVHVAISVTTLSDPLRQYLEPRTASIAQRLKTISTLAKAGIPVFVMMAPIIPGLNDHEILPLAKKVADCGALGLGYTMVRLNDDVAILFEDWIRKTMPDRAERILNRIREVHSGQLSDFRPGVRMRGEGQIAEIIRDQFKLARTLYFKDRAMPAYDLTHHHLIKNPQLSLF